MKKSIFISGIVIVVLLGGAWYGKTLLTHKMGEQVVNILQTPGVQDQINNLVKSSQNSPDVQNALNNVLSTALPARNSAANQPVPGSTTKGESNPSGKTDNASNNSGATTDSGSSNSTGSGSSPTPAPVLNNRSDAVQYAMGRFSPSEIVHYMAVYQNRQNLTEEQKNQIKSQLLSRFTPQELQSLSAAANK